MVFTLTFGLLPVCRSALMDRWRDGVLRDDVDLAACRVEVRCTGS